MKLKFNTGIICRIFKCNNTKEAGNCLAEIGIHSNQDTSKKRNDYTMRTITNMLSSIKKL